jgi:hypothetical protein
VTYSATDIFLREDNALGAPIVGAVVKVLSQDGKLVYGQAETNSDGVASFLLAVRNYQVRFFKFGVNFQNPMILELDDTPNNAFNVYGIPHVPPVSTDPRICLCSGFFRNASGIPQKGLDIHFIAKFDPLLLVGSGILSERVTVRTDDKGYATVPLIRFAEYDVTIEGLENIYRSIEVPDASAVNLPDLLFPVVKGVIFDGVAGSVSLAVGEEVELQGHVFTTDKRELEELGSDVAWSLSNPSILNFELLPGSVLKLRALSPGLCELRGERLDKTIIRIPNTPIEGLPLLVSVAP